VEGLEDHRDRVFSTLARAEDALSRLDERVRACDFRAGWTARLDFSEAIAWGWTAGGAVAAEDLVLHDQNMDVRMPDDALRAAHGLIRARRKAASVGPELLSPAGAAWLSGRRRMPPAPLGEAGATGEPSNADTPDMLGRLAAGLVRLSRGTTEDLEGAMADWLGPLAVRDRETPLLLRAAVALEAWRIVDPLPRQTYVGPILVAQWLRHRRRVRSHLPGFETGFRVESRRQGDPRGLPLGARITYWLRVIAESAEHGLEELNRLELARQVAMAKIGERRAHSHLKDVVSLLLEHPIVTAPLVAERLKLSPQTARRLIGELGATVREISGQTRYRAWRL
jgi:hypothetical protein